MESKEYSVFICHSSKDKPKVREIKAELEGEGIYCWIDEAEVLPGNTIIEKITEGIQKTGSFIIVLSQNSIESGWVNDELEKALTKEIHGRKGAVIPVVIDDCKIPDTLAHKCFADLRSAETRKTVVKSIINAIKMCPTPLQLRGLQSQGGNLNKKKDFSEELISKNTAGNHIHMENMNITGDVSIGGYKNEVRNGDINIYCKKEPGGI